MLDKEVLRLIDKVFKTIVGEKDRLKHVLVQQNKAVVTNGYMLYYFPLFAQDGFYTLSKDTTKKPSRLQLTYVGSQDLALDKDSAVYGYPAWDSCMRLVQRPTWPFSEPKKAKKFSQSATLLTALVREIYLKCPANVAFAVEYLEWATQLRFEIVRFETYEEQTVALEYMDGSVFILMGLRW